MSSHIAAMRRSFRCAGRTVVSFVALCLVLLPRGQAFAQNAQQAAPSQPVELPVISVTVPPPSKPTISAAGNSVVVSPTTIPTPSYESASSTTVITGADIESHQYRTVPDALSLVPGLNIVQTGGPGGQTSVFIRGTNSNHVKVLIDGIDVSDPSNPNQSFDFGQLLTGDIARIEVLRGPQSGLYGSDAIGGVIAITTKQGSGPPKVTATLEGGSFGTFNQRVGFGGSQENFNYVFNVQHFRSTDTPVTPLNQLAPGEHRNQRPLRQLDVFDQAWRERHRQFRRQFRSALHQFGAWLHRRRRGELLSAGARAIAEHADGPAVLRARRGRVVAVRRPLQEFLRRELHQRVESQRRSKPRQLHAAAGGRSTDDECRPAHPSRLAR